MKIILRVYKSGKAQDKGFSSVMDAQGMVELVGSSYPDVIVEPYIEIDDSSVIDLSEFEKNTA